MSSAVKRSIEINETWIVIVRNRKSDSCGVLLAICKQSRFSIATRIIFYNSCYELLLLKRQRRRFELLRYSNTQVSFTENVHAFSNEQDSNPAMRVKQF